jgi:ABC-type Na+ efflux pump permease subunit
VLPGGFSRSYLPHHLARATFGSAFFAEPLCQAAILSGLLDTLMLVAILACTWFAARLYRFGVLMYGQRPGLGQLLKLVRMN